MLFDETNFFLFVKKASLKCILSKSLLSRRLYKTVYALMCDSVLRLYSENTILSKRISPYQKVYIRYIIKQTEYHRELQNTF